MKYVVSACTKYGNDTGLIHIEADEVAADEAVPDAAVADAVAADHAEAWQQMSQCQCQTQQQQKDEVGRWQPPASSAADEGHSKRASQQWMQQRQPFSRRFRTMNYELCYLHTLLEYRETERTGTQSDKRKLLRPYLYRYRCR